MNEREFYKLFVKVGLWIAVATLIVAVLVL